jgi:hypothetical protein
MRTITITEQHDPATQITVLKAMADGEELKMQWTDQAAVDLDALHGLTLADEVRRVMYNELAELLEPAELVEAVRQLDQLSTKTE